MTERPPARFSKWSAQVAWDYDGVVTAWRLARGGEIRFLKVRKIHRHHYTLADERDRLVWAREPDPGRIEYYRLLYSLAS